MFNTLGTGLFSGRRVHVVLGGGLPSDMQYSCTTSVSFTLISGMVLILLGGSENNQTKHLPLKDNKGKVLEVLCGPYGRVCLSWLVAQRRISIFS